MFGVLLLLTLSVATYATYSNYDDTIPNIGNKVVAAGSKTLSERDYYRTQVGSVDKAFIGWVEAKLDGKWVKVSNEVTYYANTSKSYDYVGANPFEGTELRFVIKKTGGILDFGGQRVYGMIHFG